MSVSSRLRTVTIKDRSRNNGNAHDGNRKSKRVERTRRQDLHLGFSVQNEAAAARQRH